MNYYIPIKRNDVLKHATIGMYSEYTTESEKAGIKRSLII